MNKQLIHEIAIRGRKMNLGLCVISDNLSNIDNRLLAQSVQKIPLSINDEEKYILSTIPIFGSSEKYY